MKAANEQAGQGIACPVCGAMTIVPARRSVESDPPVAKTSGPPRLEPASPPKPPPLPADKEPVLAEPRLGSRSERRTRQTPAIVAAAYHPDRGRVETVRWLAVILGLVVAFGAAPGVMYLDFATAPGWARLVLMVALVEAVYILWMAATPDWSTVWVLMLLFALVTAGYATVTAIAISTPLDAPLPLGMGEIRQSAGRWCGSVLLIHGLATYLCGRTSTKWRRSLELEEAAARRQLDGRH